MNKPTLRLLSLLWEAFKSVQGHFLAVFGVVLSFVAWVILPSEKWVVDVRQVLLGIVFFVFCALVVINFFVSLVSEILNREEEIVRLKGLSLPAVIDSFFDSSKEELILILERTEIFSFGSSVAIYGLFGLYETFLGFGVVHNVQGNGLVQIKITDFEPQYESFVQNVKNKTPGALSGIIVKNHTQQVMV